MSCWTAAFLPCVGKWRFAEYCVSNAYGEAKRLSLEAFYHEILEIWAIAESYIM